MKFVLTIIKLVFLCSFIYAAILLWQRPARSNLEERFFYGVNYKRIVLSEPRRIIAHVLEIDRYAPGLKAFVTPAQLNGKMQSTITSNALEKYHFKIAINGGFFNPQWVNHPLDYYPHEGDEVQMNSLSISNGQTYAEFKPGYNTICIKDDLRMEIVNTLCPKDTTNAVSGSSYILKQGEIYQKGEAGTHPRSAIGFSEKLNKIWLVTVDGRQIFYSEGMELEELANFMKALGAEEALELDGGGSSTLVVAKKDGSAEVLNSPIQTGIYGRQRPVGNHIGFYLDSERLSE